MSDPPTTRERPRAEYNMQLRARFTKHMQKVGLLTRRHEAPWVNRTQWLARSWTRRCRYSAPNLFTRNGGGKQQACVLLPTRVTTDQLIPADRLMHAPGPFRKSGLLDSSSGIGRLTSVPKFAPAFEVLSGSYGPFGNTDSAFRPYCQIRRRISPRR